jgi:exopolyphosphatase/guanosine-5'-triphosphate,3'-diphosphate pyrophosphatase
VPAAVNIAAIDAGSNAIRLLVARAEPEGGIEKLQRKRSAVRLGRNAFTRHELDEDTIAHAVQAFANFRHTMDKYKVKACRAVATSATRSAHNRRTLIARIEDRTGIRLEVIDGIEEARLVQTAVFHTLGPKRPPRLVLDLGGGSLELSFLRGRDLERSVTLPVGTVRLMESFGIEGPVGELEAHALGEYVRDALAESVPAHVGAFEGLVAASGGNAETLAQYAAGRPVASIHTLDLRVLEGLLPRLLAMDVAKRQKVFEVRKDRAEVMGIAALVLVQLGRWLGLHELLVPGVGVREGVVIELAAEHFGRQPSALATP